MTDSDNEPIAEQHRGQLGQIVTWRVPETVALADLRAALTTAGLAQELVADMEPRNALRRAFRDMKENRIIRLLRRDGDYLWFQFTAEQLSKYEAKYSKEAELSLNVETGDVSCDVGALAVKAKHLLNEHMEKRLTSDLTRLVQRIFDSHKSALVAIREQGGCYFVPDMHRDVVAKTKLFLNAIGGKMPSYAIRFGDGDTADSVAENLADHVRGLIEEWRETCSNLTTETRQDVKDRRLKRASEIEQTIRCYESLLMGYASACKRELAAGKDELFKAFAQAGQAKPEQKPNQPAAKPRPEYVIPGSGGSLFDTHADPPGLPMDAPLQGVGN